MLRVSHVVQKGAIMEISLLNVMIVLWKRTLLMILLVNLGGAKEYCYGY